MYSFDNAVYGFETAKEILGVGYQLLPEQSEGGCHVQL
nr:MAG TPA: hypothetical protein [Caudoviricetes sp.]